MVMAMRQREITAQTLAKWTRALVLSTTDCAFASKESALLHIRPWGADLASVAAHGHEASSIEAHILG